MKGLRNRIVLLLVFVLLLAYSLPASFFRIRSGKANATGLVRNINTGLSYVSIQEAIDASPTADGHVLLVDPGMYLDHVRIYKSLKIMGSGAETTIIDGGGLGTVVYVNACNVVLSGLTVRNGGNSSVDFLNSGVFIEYCENVTLSNNTVMNCRYGVYVFRTADSRLIDNKVLLNSEDGIWLYYSGGNTLERNTMTGNKYNFGVFGQSFADFNNTVDSSNIVEGKPIRYEIGLSDKVLDSRTEVGTLYLINAHNVTVRDLCLSGNGNGVFLWNTTESKVENLTVAGNNYGVFLQESDRNSILRNTCPNNWVGIFLESSSRNTVKGNSAPANEKGISLYGSSDNLLEGNTVADNLYGIRFYASSSNTIWHNSLVENTHQADLVNSHNNGFDDGSEGNFWSGYEGLDANEDGIGDSAYAFGGEQDRFPLMGRFYEFDVHSDSEDHRLFLICDSLITGLAFEATGDGDRSVISFNVTNESEKPRFCRITVPTAFLKAPYTIRAFDSSWFNLTSGKLSFTDDAWAQLFVRYNSSVRSIAIAGTTPRTNLSLDLHAAVLLCVVVGGSCLVVILVIVRRKSKAGTVR